MPVDLEGRAAEPATVDRLAGGWRAIGSAWALVLVVMLLFAGFSAMSARSSAPHNEAALARVVIPMHNPACADMLYSDPNATPDQCPKPVSRPDFEDMMMAAPL